MSRLLITLALLAAACAPSPSPAPDEGGRLAANIRLHLLAGPVCPVETTPPDPACAPRPIEGGQIAITGADGAVTLLTAGSDGVAVTRLAAGRYSATPMKVDGVLGTAAPFELVIEDEGVVLDRDVLYDTGIR